MTGLPKWLHPFVSPKIWKEKSEKERKEFLASVACTQHFVTATEAKSFQVTQNTGHYPRWWLPHFVGKEGE